jgi:hypothetical protein
MRNRPRQRQDRFGGGEKHRVPVAAHEVLHLSVGLAPVGFEAEGCPSEILQPGRWRKSGQIDRRQFGRGLSLSDNAWQTLGASLSNSEQNGRDGQVNDHAKRV